MRPPSVMLQREIVLCSLEQMQIVVARYILVQGSADTLGVAHLTEHAAIGRGNTLDGPNRTIGVEVHIHRGRACQIHILGCDLAIRCQLLQQLLTAQEAAFTVGNGHIHHISYLHLAEPGGIIGSHSGPHDAALMAADHILAQGGAGLIGIDDLTKGHQTQLDQRLEAVTDAQH